jgi:hypothetical protein
MALAIAVVSSVPMLTRCGVPDVTVLPALADRTATVPLVMDAMVVRSTPLPIPVTIVAVPVQVAEPLAAVAEVGAADAPEPWAVMMSGMPGRLPEGTSDVPEYVPLSATVAVAVEELLNDESKQVCPAVPVAVMPDT